MIDYDKLYEDVNDFHIEFKKLVRKYIKNGLLIMKGMILYYWI